MTVRDPFSRTIGEIIEKVLQEKTNEGKVSVLKDYDNPVIRKVLNWIYNPEIQFYQIDNLVYDPVVDTVPSRHPSLYNENRRLELFILEDGRNFTQERYGRLAGNILSIVHENESRIFAPILSKGIKCIAGIDGKVLFDAYGDQFAYLNVTVETFENTAKKTVLKTKSIV
jgi:hypothetical protein